MDDTNDNDKGQQQRQTMTTTNNNNKTYKEQRNNHLATLNDRGDKQLRQQTTTTMNGKDKRWRRRKRSMRGVRSRIIIVIILIKLLIPLPTSSISLSTYIISPIKAQNTSPMVWWWRLYTWPGCTTCTGDSNPSFCSHQLIVTYFCICNHSIFSFQSLNYTKSSKDIPINGVSKGSAHLAGTHWAYWFINPSLFPPINKM